MTGAAFKSASMRAKSFQSQVKKLSLGKIATGFARMDRALTGVATSAAALGGLTVVGGMAALSKAVAASVKNLDNLNDSRIQLGLTLQSIRRFSFIAKRSIKSAHLLI